MKNFHFRLFLINILLIILAKGTAQNININTRSENIQINEDTSFTKQVSVSLKFSEDQIIYPIFYDGELEEVTDITVFSKKGKRLKPLKNIDIIEDKVEGDFITSKKVKFIIIPPELEATINYTVRCNELMYFTDLRFFSYDDVDTLKYRVTVPNQFRFSHNIIDKDSLNHLVVDSVMSDGFMKWYIEVVPVKIKADPLVIFGIYKNLKAPLMRTIVVPAGYQNKEKQYLNDWYLNKVETKRGLDSTAMIKIDKLTKGISDPKAIMDTLYNYVKENFKYVAIEIGMGAFVPSHANDVFINKHGDCKDLSNFLSEALNYKGVKSQVALAATYNHICDCDFPSLGSANHVVCVAYIKDKPIILDPTDPIHIPETPVQSIQERSVLIINPDGGEYHKINSLSKQNVINYEIELKVDTDRKLMEGIYKAAYKGISGNFLKRAFLGISKKEMNTIGIKHYKSVFGNQSVEDININNLAKSIEVEGKVSVQGKIFSDDNNQYLFIDFLPPIIESEYRETLLEGTHLGSTIDKRVLLRITMDEAFEDFNTIEHTFQNNGVSLNLRISNPSDFIIECEYEFKLDHIHIENKNLNNTNEILKSFKKITNEPIILKYRN